MKRRLGSVFYVCCTLLACVMTMAATTQGDSITLGGAIAVYLLGRDVRSISRD